MNKHVCRSLLVALFDLTRANRPATLDRLARRLGLPRSVIRGALLDLEERGFCDAERMRLTLPGLGLAVALADTSDRAAGGRHAA